MKPLITIALVSLLAGCVPVGKHEDYPVAPVDRTDEVIAAINGMPHPQPVDLSPVDARLAAIESKLAATGVRAGAVKSSGYTGIKVFVHPQRGVCIPCDRVQDDLTEWVRGTPWDVGPGAANHFWLVHDADEYGALTPRFELWRQGELIDSWEGYTGDIEGLVRRHPYYPKQRSTRRTSAIGTSTTYGSSGDVLGAYDVTYTLPSVYAVSEVMVGAASAGGYGTASVGGYGSSQSSVGGYGSAGYSSYGASPPRTVIRRGRARYCVNGVCY